MKSQILNLLMLEQAQAQAHIPINTAIEALEKAAFGYISVEMKNGNNLITPEVCKYSVIRIYGNVTNEFNINFSSGIRCYTICNATTHDAIAKVIGSSTSVKIMANATVKVFTYNSDVYLLYSISSGGAPTPTGKEFENCTLIEDVPLQSGQYTETNMLIPIGAIVQCVNGRVIEKINGASSINIGVSGTPGMWATEVGTAIDTTFRGVTYAPIGFSYNAAVRITSNDELFTGGKVRIALYYTLCAIPK